MKIYLGALFICNRIGYLQALMVHMLIVEPFFYKLVSLFSSVSVSSIQLASILSPLSHIHLYLDMVIDYIFFPASVPYVTRDNFNFSSSLIYCVWPLLLHLLSMFMCERYLIVIASEFQFCFTSLLDLIEMSSFFISILGGTSKVSPHLSPTPSQHHHHHQHQQHISKILISICL